LDKGILTADLESVQQQKRIMVIDDDPDVTMTLQTVLQQNGFRTDPYDDPVTAYKNFRDGVYDLVLLDIKMPIVDGFLLYQKIRRTDKRVRICFLTASEFYRERFRKEQGFDGFDQESLLKKPIDMKDLVDTTKKLLDS
jgi:DNA-binding response OmpR family regulator